jgi:hypothetical protein
MQRVGQREPFELYESRSFKVAGPPTTANKPVRNNLTTSQISRQSDHRPLAGIKAKHRESEARAKSNTSAAQAKDGFVRFVTPFPISFTQSPAKWRSAVRDNKGDMLILEYEENNSADRDAFIALRGNLGMC